MRVAMSMIVFMPLFLAVLMFMSAVIVPFHATHLTSVAGPPAETGVLSETRSNAATPAGGLLTYLASKTSKNKEPGACTGTPSS